MHERDFPIPLFGKFIRFGKGKAEAFRFAKIELFVLLAKIGTPRASPPTRARNNEIADFNRVRLQEIKGIVGGVITELGNAVPPMLAHAVGKSIATFVSKKEFKEAIEK